MAVQELEKQAVVKAAVDAVARGELTLNDLLKALVPAPAAPPEPATLPLPAVITPKQREALEKITKIFGRVVPDSRTALSETELKHLIEERITLDELAKLAETRKEGIRTTFFNHLDVQLEEEGKVGPDTPKDKHGHYVVPGEARAKGADRRLTREVREGSPAIDAEALKSLVEAGELSHEDYLAMTVQTRQLDERKVMGVLKEKPELIGVLAKATRPGQRTAAFCVRKA